MKKLLKTLVITASIIGVVYFGEMFYVYKSEQKKDAMNPVPDVIYKKEIYEHNRFDDKCNISKKSSEIDAIHLVLRDEERDTSKIEFIYNEKVIGDVILDAQSNVAKYKNLFDKEYHYEGIIEYENIKKIFFYPGQYKDIAQLLLSEQQSKEKEINIMARLYKNDYNKHFKEKSFFINLNKFTSEDFKFLAPKLDIQYSAKKLSVDIDSKYSYNLVFQTKEGSPKYKEKHSFCLYGECLKESYSFEIDKNVDYLAYLVFLKNTEEFTYEYKKEYFSDKIGKSCMEMKG